MTFFEFIFIIAKIICAAGGIAASLVIILLIVKAIKGIKDLYGKL
jgi:hypothetical protein